MTENKEISELSAAARAESAESAESRATIYSKLIFFLLCAFPILAVVFYGAVDTGSLAVSALFAAFIIILWLADALKSGEFKYNSSRLQIPLVGLISIGLIQLLPLRSFGVSADLLAAAPVGALSLNPYITRLAVIQLTVYLVYFAAALTFVNHRKRFKTLVLTIIIFSSLMAFYGILQRLAAADSIYGMRPALDSIAFASFFNQHHFAAFIEMTIGLTLGILFGRGAAKNMRILLITAALIMGMAIIFTGSRGGMISFTIVLGFIIFANILQNKQSSEENTDEIKDARLRRSLTLIGGGLILIFVLFGLVIWLGGDQNLLRGVGLSNQTDVSSGRGHFWSIALRIFADYPVLGAGLDAFGTAFPFYDTNNGMYRVEQAHNDYLQILADAGIAGFVCVVGFIILLFKKGLKTISETSDGFHRNAAVGALAGCLGIIVHSFFDFPLRTPSNSLYFLTLATLATVFIYHPSRRRRK